MSTMKFCISLEKLEKSRYLCNSMTYLHKIQHNDVERASKVHLY